MRAKSFPLICGIVLCLLWPAAAAADNLRITSEPSGATVEIDGVVVGKTPYEVKLPGGYFHGTRTVYGKRLGTPMHARISLAGYVTQELELTRGPIPWVNTYGVYYGDYYLLKTDHFHFEFEKTAEKLTGSVRRASVGGAPAKMLPDLPPEKIVEMAAPAVLFLKCPEWTGTGFFVTETGVIATNAHVARGLRTMTAIDPSGKQWDATVVYVDDKLDLALLKAEGEQFPHLTLGATSAVRPGETVLAIGNPGGGMPNTVTKGIVSAVGPLEGLHGTWVQTDAAVNHGNSGGPLLNAQAEVIGLNTLIHRGRGKDQSVQGIAFALSADDLTNLLARFYPRVAAASQGAANGQGDGSTGKIEIASTPEYAEIYVDDKLIGTTPSTISLPTGPHKIRVSSKGFKDWDKQVEILKDSQARLKATLEPLD